MKKLQIKKIKRELRYSKNIHCILVRILCHANSVKYEIILVKPFMVSIPGQCCISVT